MHYIIRTGINGGSSVISVDPQTIQNLDLGVDGKVRIVYSGDSKSYPIQEILEAPKEFHDAFEKLLKYS